MIAEDADQLFDIGQMRNVFERQRVVRQQRGDHQRQGGILGAGNRDDATELIAAGNSDTIHEGLTGAARLSESSTLKGMGVFRRIPNTLQFAAERTLRFVHFCGR